MLELFKEGAHMSVKTDANSEGEFMDQFCEALAELIDKGWAKDDWKFQFHYWLPQLVDICCAYRGYKTGVEKKTVYIAGTHSPSPADSVILVGQSRPVVVPEAEETENAVQP